MHSENTLDQLSVGNIATLASLLEVTAPKPGNVHRGADFEDVTFTDFVTSGVLLGETIDRSAKASIGSTVLDAVRWNQQIVGTNTNLGIVLLLVPMAKCLEQQGKLDVESMNTTLAQLNKDDCRFVYEAIKIASPGGLGSVDKHDVNDSAPDDLLKAMAFSAKRDRVAKQYTDGFFDVFQEVVALLVQGQEQFSTIEEAIVFAHVSLMARFPDSLIVRKNGSEVGDKTVSMAGDCIDALQLGTKQFYARVSDLDLWLRSDGHRRNPGTTADLIAAGLFAAIANSQIRLKTND